MEQPKIYQINGFTVEAKTGYSDEGKPVISVTSEIDGVKATISLGYESEEKRNADWEKMTDEDVEKITAKVRMMITEEIEAEEEPLFPEY